MERRKTIDKLTEHGSYRDALFYRHPGGLRFELSSGGDALELVLTALQRATAVCKNIFDGSASILVHLQRYAPQNRFQLRSTLRELRAAGIDPPRSRSIWLDAVSEDEKFSFDVGYWVQCAFELPVAKLQALLWCALTCDFPSLRPNPGCRIYLIHPDKDIIVHPYDDRGMDVIGRGKPTLAALYRKHKDWLLAYDIAAMAQTFETTPEQPQPAANGANFIDGAKMQLNDVEVVKDADTERPIPSAWRPVIQRIVDAFVCHDYLLAAGIPGVARVSTKTARQIQDYIGSYGETLVALPAETWKTSVCIWTGRHWDALIDLWTADEGPSDMVLKLDVAESDATYLFDIQLVYVP
ncbi:MULTISPECIES: DUF3885 domain-containing protein [unclassified Massilia]|uniref:DUF3885 domain-containing protein n=1 Tax=unclassified Massilia TaxID=2609279 RepID=UPI00177FF53D|nr:MULTISPECIES: DUF3885 domain-containing protein [unclassified Massilia]MBD8533342.1 DUF3885 domain-containing protein [Massilia sp. CFBP 13647]MBD8676735.1 DUF3885 domain-containing protein [Massilia sp. CFBP 13721]